MCAALSSVILTARLNSAQPNAGLSYELDAVAAVAIGGTSLFKWWFWFFSRNLYIRHYK